MMKRMKRKGIALVMSYLIVAAFAAIAVSILYNAINEKSQAYRHKLMTEAFYLAEGATENAIVTFENAMVTSQIAPDIATYTVNTSFSTFSGASAVSTFTRSGSEYSVIENGANIKVLNYSIRTEATHPSTANMPENWKVKAVVNQSIARRIIYAIQHGVFYDNDLEIFPSSSLTITGRIHGNKDVYLGSESSITIKIDSDYFRAGGSIYNKRKDSNPSSLPGTVNVKVNQLDDYKTIKLSDGSILDSSNANWTLDSQTRWLGTAQTAVHGVTRIAVPSQATIQPNGYYAQNADVVVTNSEIRKGGRLLVEGADYPVGTITTSTVFYNNREGKNIKMTIIDIAKLSNSNTPQEKDQSGNPFPNNLPADTNNLMYVTRSDSSWYEPGVKIINGSKLYGRANGLTLVSNDPVYIKGNYNTLLDSGAAGRKPASVICDAINLLSNNWTDSNSYLNVDYRTATETTYNSAFIAGVDNTTFGHYNGGLENYARLHENWTNIKLSITGSFVALWNSQVATGAWKYGSPCYLPPIRQWMYDNNFNTDSGRPRFSPFMVGIQRIAWWKS
jgi:hypothetical protein